jgi:hypothetical protein
VAIDDCCEYVYLLHPYSFHPYLIFDLDRKREAKQCVARLTKSAKSFVGHGFS